MVYTASFWARLIPCHVSLRQFRAKSATAITLSQADPEGHPLADPKAISELRVTLADEEANLSLPARSVTFVQLHRE